MSCPPPRNWSASSMAAPRYPPPDAVAYHVAGIDRVHRNLVACDAERQQFRLAPSQHAHVHLRAARPPQPPHDVGGLHLHPGNERVFDVYHAVAGQYAHLLGGTSRHRLHHEERVLQHLELHPDAVEAALQRLAHPLHLVARDVGRVRVEFPQQAGDDILHHPAAVDAIHVQVGDGHERVVQFALVGRPDALRMPPQGQQGEQGDDCLFHSVVCFFFIDSHVNGMQR